MDGEDINVVVFFELPINIQQSSLRNYKTYFYQTKTMLLDVHKISLIYDFWKSNNGETYVQDASELSRKLTDSDAIDGK